jgi:hypothetical protein
MKTKPLTSTSVGILRKEQSSTPYPQKTILTKHHTQLTTTSLASLYGFPWLSQATSGLLFSKNSSLVHGPLFLLASAEKRLDQKKKRKRINLEGNTHGQEINVS